MGNAMQGSAYYYTQGGRAEVVLCGGKPQRFPWHMHMRHWTVGVVLAGAVQLEQPAAIRTLGPGQHFVLPPCASHSITLDAQAQLLTLCMAYENEPSTVWQALHSVLQHVHAAQGTLANVGYEDGVKAMLEQLFPLPAAKTLSQFCALSACPATLVAQAIVQRILDAPEQPFSLVHMAQEAGYSPWHFLRMFQRHMGVTPHALITLCRVRMVRQALRADAAGAEAAASAGFSDQSHMVRVFKQHHNMTPGQFAKASVKVG